jgi:putative aldouronate transport system permease protein
LQLATADGGLPARGAFAESAIAESALTESAIAESAIAGNPRDSGPLAESPSAQKSAATRRSAARRSAPKRSLWKQARKMWLLYVFLAIPLGMTLLFSYAPMYGIQLAFKDFRVADGIWGSKWNGFKHFEILFSGRGFAQVLKNTIYISVMRIVTGFPVPILFALLLNEVRHLRYKKFVQTVSYLPYFMSWVVLGGIIQQILSPQRGVVNWLIGLFGVPPIYFLSVESMFVPILLITSIWQGAGWGAVIYLASMSSIDPGLYESAEIDGAGRFRRALHITVPMLAPVIVIQFILSMGGILNAGFDQIFNLMNPRVMDVADIIDTYVYRMGMEEMRYDFSTAVGLFKNVIGFGLVLLVNFFTGKFTEYGL